MQVIHSDASSRERDRLSADASALRTELADTRDALREALEWIKPGREGTPGGTCAYVPTVVYERLTRFAL